GFQHPAAGAARQSESFQSTSSIAAKPNLAFPTEEIFVKDGFHGFQREASICRPPCSPVAGFIFKNTVIIPSAFHLCLYGKLLELLKWSSGVVPCIKKDDGCPQFIDEVHDGSLVIRRRILQGRCADHVVRP